MNRFRRRCSIGRLTKDDAQQVADLLVKARRERIRLEKTEANEVTAEGVTMRYETVRFDDEPEGTPRSLFISMHGGGSGPAQMNDGQWRNQSHSPRRTGHTTPSISPLGLRPTTGTCGTNPNRPAI
jgi:hypothetical protein